MPSTYLGHGTAWVNAAAYVNISLSQALTAGCLHAKLNSAEHRRQAIPGRGYVSAINVHICSVVLGCAGGYVPVRSAKYENQALTAKVIR